MRPACRGMACHARVGSRQIGSKAKKNVIARRSLPDGPPGQETGRQLRRSDKAISDFSGKSCAPEGQHIYRKEDLPVFATPRRGGT